MTTDERVDALQKLVAKLGEEVDLLRDLVLNQRHLLDQAVKLATDAGGMAIRAIQGKGKS